jgi:hypothetical protein
MSFNETDDALVWWCDAEGCGVVIAFEREDVPGFFIGCVGELKGRGWRIERDRYGEWVHTCPKCRKGSRSRVLDMPSNKLRGAG